MATPNLYGLTERSNNFTLHTTRYGDPYRLYAVDKFPHTEFDDLNLYSGIPYIMGHGNDGTHDEAVLWINGADTYVDIIEDN
jgi:alpha-glucosidase (family GH31 glycosyl hydrolase)